MTGPDKNEKLPLGNYNRLCFLKNIIKNPNIIVGDYTYYDDFEDVHNFEKNGKYHFDFIGDKLIIGKFCMLASGVTFYYEWSKSFDRSNFDLSICHFWWELAKRNGWQGLSF
jgi:acetyltransferase-like isoleucine patch superfamily enzyme